MLRATARPSCFVCHILISFPVVIEANKEGVKFSCNGDIGNGSVTIRQHTNVDKPDQNVTVNISEPVALTFSLKYLVNFCKASNLSSSVVLHLSQEVPLLVEYGLGSGHLRFYLAPKVSARSDYSLISLVSIHANLWPPRSSVTTSKRTICGVEGTEAMLKMMPNDNGENPTEEMFPHCIPNGDYKMFTIIYIFSGRLRHRNLFKTSSKTVVYPVMSV